MKGVKILLAEDDENLGFVVEDHLVQAGFDTVHAADGELALRAFRNQSFDLCIIDVMMPKMDGFTLAERIRLINEFVPIIFLTAKSMEDDRLRGFAIGGDDYVTKPFSISELICRVRVFLRRKIEVGENRFIVVGTLKFDESNLQVLGAGGCIQLTRMEADLLKLLLANRNRLVRREDILISIWGENDYFKGRSLDVFITRLRKYLKGDPMLEIRNHHGVGFMLIDSNFTG